MTLRSRESAAAHVRRSGRPRSPYRAGRSRCDRTFRPLAARTGREGQRPKLITANQQFGEWGRIFPDQAMTLAAIGRLVHHATILEMNVESYRRKAALDRKRGRGRPPACATRNKLEKAKSD